MANKVKIKAIKTSASFKVLDISGEPGDVLSNHKVNHNALLHMKSGSLIYKEDGRTEVLSAGESCDIPADVFHQITCTTKAKFIVLMPDLAKVRFEK